MPSSVPASSPSLLADLRAATGPMHEALDSSVGLVGPTVTREKYVATLRGSLAVVEPLETGAAKWLGVRDEISRVARLRADLASLGEDPAVAAPPFVETPTIDTEAKAMGVLYVLEGSTLGGIVLARSVDRALGLEGQSISYLTLRGPLTPEKWRAFLVELDAWAKTAPPAAWREACEAARAAFVAYRKALEVSGAITSP